MPGEVILSVSYFDSILGPNLLHSSSPLNSEEHPDLGRILEFTEEEGNFIFTFRKFQTINHIFYIDSDLARGGKELLMITYMIRAAYFKDEITDVYNYLLSKTPDLESYASELKNLKELKELLHGHKNHINQKEILNLASDTFKEDFSELFDKYLTKMSPQLDLTSHLLDKGNLKKIYIFGPRNAGKTELVKTLEVIQFLQYKNNNMKRDLSSKIYDFIIDNIEVLTYECVDDDTDNQNTKLYEDCIDNAQGFILIFNASNKSTLKETVDMFQLVLNRCQDKGDTLPILIIGNKFDDEEKITSEMIFENFDLTELKECGIPLEYFAINVLTEDDKVINAIRWMVTHLI
jgi:GTPase SAR1 family protein